MNAKRFEPASLVGLPEREIPRMLPGENHVLVLARRGAPEGWPREIVERERAAQVDSWRRVDSDGVVRPFTAFPSEPGAPAFVYERWFRAARPMALLLFDEEGICRHADGPEVTAFTRKLDAAEELESALGIAPPEAQLAAALSAARINVLGEGIVVRDSEGRPRHVPVGQRGVRFSAGFTSQGLFAEDVYAGSLPIRAMDESETEWACELVRVAARVRPVLEVAVREVRAKEAFSAVRAWISVPDDPRSGEIAIVDDRGRVRRRLAISRSSVRRTRSGSFWITAG